MKHKKSLVLLTTMALIWTSLSAFAHAETAPASTAFELGYQGSGFYLVVPGEVEPSVVERTNGNGDSFEVEVLALNLPEPESDGTYALFALETNDEWAYYAESYTGTFAGVHTLTYSGQFEDGKVTFYYDRELIDAYEDEILSLRLIVYDEADDYLVDFLDLHLVFANEEPSAPGKPLPAQDAAAKPTSSSIIVDGEAVAFEAYNINGNNYFKLRDLAMAVNGSDKQFEVEWDEALNAIGLLSNKAYTPVGNELAVSGDPSSKPGKPATSDIYLDGEQLELTAYKIGGNNYFKLRDIAAAFDFGVTWEPETRTVSIDTSIGYTPE